MYVINTPVPSVVVCRRIRLISVRSKSGVYTFQFIYKYQFSVVGRSAAC